MYDRLDFFEEPLLEFGYGQRATNPKAGLYFYGPLDDRARPKHIKVGVVGTPAGIALYRDWATEINSYIGPPVQGSMNHVPFPGLNSLFSCTISPEAERQIELSPSRLAAAIRISPR